MSTLLQKIKTATLIGVFVVVLATGSLIARDTAMSGLIGGVVGIPRGGLNISTFPCTCSGVVLLLYAPGFIGPVPGSYTATYVPGTQAFAYWTIGQPGAWDTGLGGPPAVCAIVTVSPPCTIVGIPALYITPFHGSSI